MSLPPQVWGLICQGTIVAHLSGLSGINPLELTGAKLPTFSGAHPKRFHNCQHSAVDFATANIRRLASQMITHVTVSLTCESPSGAYSTWPATVSLPHYWCSREGEVSMHRPQNRHPPWCRLAKGDGRLRAIWTPAIDRRI